MAEEERKKSFWETLPGIITAIGGLLMGVAAVIAALNGGGKEGATKIDAPAAKPSSAPSTSDDAAQRAAELERKLAEAASAKKQAEEEAEAAKAEAEQAKTEAAAALAQAAEAERRAAAVEAARLAAEEEQAKAQEAAPKQGDVITDDATGMKLAYVPGGCFMMGSPPNEEGHYDDQGPVHKVCVDSFWIGQYEVTQGQWEKVMDVNPSKFKKGGNYPVENVSWDDVQGFIKKLNSRSSKNYRLPTEAEWEYACRANSPGRYCGGDDVDAVAWYDKNSGGSTHPVGGKHENGFSLYDMSGNVWEWCADWYDSGYYASSPQHNPVGSESDSYRVVRGGSWNGNPDRVRAAVRIGNAPVNCGYGLGFRLVLPVQQDGR